VVLKFTRATADLVGESAAQWQAPEKPVRVGRWTSGPRNDEGSCASLQPTWGAPLAARGLGARRELLKTRDNPSSLEPLLVTFDAGAESGHEPHSHVGDEFLIVIKGRPEIRVNSRVYHMRSGGSLTFPSSVPHRWRNPGRGRAVAVWVNTPPSW
jgi:mannose-6-phosphate isomerase-like protein (cupin superfamily)